jgi:hypothetical protein
MEQIEIETALLWERTPAYQLPVCSSNQIGDLQHFLASLRLLCHRENKQTVSLNGVPLGPANRRPRFGH